MKIQQLAAYASKHFEQRQRPEGERFYCTIDDSPEWITDLCREAHGDMLPDDFRYAMIVEALDAISESDDDEESESISDRVEPPIGLKLKKWFMADRESYVDQSVDTYGYASHVMIQLTWGWREEFDEAFYSVLESLKERLEEIEDEDEDEDK